MTYLDSSDKKEIFTMGKGSVGKTTVAAAIALGLSKKGKKVHLTTTDPATHLKYVIDETSGITMSHIDEREDLKKYRNEVLSKARENGLSDEDIAYIEEDLRSPCTQEISVFRAFAEIVEKADDEIVVIDTAPTEHLSYQMQEKPFEIFEEDFTKTMMDYLMFKQGIDVKEFSDVLVKKVMYDSYITSHNNNVVISISNEDTRDEKIDATQWKEFVIKDLFTVKRPLARSQANYDDGDVPFVASGNFNNGVLKYLEPKKGEILDVGNCITVSPIDGNSFYQENDFLGRGGAGSSIILLYNPNLNIYNGYFIATVIRTVCRKYAYSDMANKDTIVAEKIKLPVTSDGTPDYDYMTEFISKIKCRSVIALKNLQTLDKVLGCP